METEQPRRAIINMNIPPQYCVEPYLGLDQVFRDAGYCVTVDNRWPIYATEDEETGGMYAVPAEIDSYVDLQKRDERIASDAGLVIPRSYTPREMFEAEESIVAKTSRMHKGKGTFLLKNVVEKSRFLAFMKVFDDSLTNLVGFLRLLAPEQDQKFNDAAKEVIFYDNIPEGSRNWYFQERIIPSEDKVRSIRVVSDFHGNLQYIHANIKPENSSDQATIEPLEYTELEEIAFKPWLESFTGPFSDFQSNHMQRVRLDSSGRPLDNDIEFPQLENFDQLVRASKEIAYKKREAYPFTAIDVIYRDGSYYFLEAQAPDIPSDIIEACDPHEAQMKMLTLVANRQTV